MKLRIISLLLGLTAISLAGTTSLTAENLSDLNKLLGTKKCQSCDLSRSGLIHANLIGAELSNANLANANLSQANLAGADLSGANLAGTSLYGANLTGANLSGANLAGTDLRNAYLTNVDLENVDLDQANLDGVKGLSSQAGTPEQFHRWAVSEADRGNYPAAIAHYNRAINLDEEFAPAYLGLGIVYYQNENRPKTKEHVQVALNLFEQQENELGKSTAQKFLSELELAEELELEEEERQKRGQGSAKLGKSLVGIGSLLLRLLI